MALQSSLMGMLGVGFLAVGAAAACVSLLKGHTQVVLVAPSCSSSSEDKDEEEVINGKERSGRSAPTLAAIRLFISMLRNSSRTAAAASAAPEGQDRVEERRCERWLRGQRGRLVLVGAGPGDPRLLTVAALEALASADIVVSDRLVPPEILSLAAGEVIVANKTYGRAHEAQEEIYWRIEEALRGGQTVVRLKGGDPFVFGRGGEEVLHFRALGYEAEVIPGISSALAAPLLAGIPVTTRGVASQVLVTTGHGENDSDADLPPYAPNRTTVLLMGVSRLGQLTESLMAKAGYPGSLPCAIVESASLARQRVTMGTLETLAAEAERVGVCAPATLVLGNAVLTLRE